MEDKIKQWGLTTYEAKVYKALIIGGTNTAHKIAKISGVPDGKIYPVLDSLESKGFIRIQQGQPKIYIPISPEIVFENVLKNKQQRLNDLQSSAKEIISAFGILSLDQKKSEDAVEVYYGHKASFARSISLHNQAKKYWKTISKLTINKEHLESCAKAIKKNVDVKAITSQHETNHERINEWKKKGIKIKLLDNLPFRMSIYDDMGVIFRFSHEPSKQYVSVHIINPKLAIGMNSLFEQLWKQAKNA